MKLEGIYMFDYEKELYGCQLSMLSNNSELINLFDGSDFDKVNDKFNSLKDMERVVEESDGAKPYKVYYRFDVDNDKEDDLNYPEYFIEKVNARRGSFPLKDVDSLYEKDHKNKLYVPYNALFYVLKDEELNIEYIYMYKIGSRALVSNHRLMFGKIFLFNNSKVNSENVAETKVCGFSNNFFSLSTNFMECIAALKISADGSKELAVLKPLDYNEVFKNRVQREKIAEKNISNFNTGKFLIAGKMQVEIKDSKDISVSEIIKQNDDILKGLERYRDNKNRKIKKTPTKEFKEGLTELRDHAKGTKYAKEHSESDSFYYQDEVPKVITDKNGLEKLQVTANSLPIFVALIENIAVKRILNGIYEIPYFKHKFYKNLNEGEWTVGKDIDSGKYKIRTLIDEADITVKRGSEIIFSKHLKDDIAREESECAISLKNQDILIVKTSKIQLVYN